MTGESLAIMTLLLAGGFMGVGLMVFAGACYVMYLILTPDD